MDVLVWCTAKASCSFVSRAARLFGNSWYFMVLLCIPGLWSENSSTTSHDLHHMQLGIDMDDEDGRCLLDVICDPQALNDFLHGSETQRHVPEVQPPAELSTTEPPGLPRVSVDLDFLEDDDILGGSPGGGGGGGNGESNGVESNHEPCDILQQSLAEANITEQSLQEADAELDLTSFGLTGITQVVQPLPDASLPAVGIGGNAQIFQGQAATNTPSGSAADMLGSVLAHPGLQLQPQVMNKAINVQPFMQQVGLGNVTLQPISGLQAVPNGGQSGHLGIGQIQVVGQPTVMTINPSGQQILAKTMSGYQLHQPGLDAAGSGTPAGLGGGLLIQGGKPTLNGPAVCVSNTSTNSSGTTMAASSSIVGFARGPQTASQTQPQPQNQIMQNVIIQRTPTPIQPKPPQGGTLQTKLFKPQQQMPGTHAMQNDSNKTLGMQQVPGAAAQNVAFLAGKPSSNVVLSTQSTTQGAQFSQALFKHGTAASGKPLSVHVLNQQGSIVIPSQAVLQGQNHQFLLPQLQTGGQILTQQPGGHIIASSGPGQIIAANQILTTNPNINIGQVLAPQGHPGAAHILSGPIQLQSGQMGHPTLFQMPVSISQSQNQHVQTVIQGMPIQNSLPLEGLSPAVSLQPTLQPQAGGIPGNSSTGVAAMAQCQPGDNITVLGSSTELAAQSQPQSSIPTVKTGASVSASMSLPPSASPSSTVTTSTAPVSTVGMTTQVQHSPGKVLFTPPSSGIILSQEPVQMFLQQVSSVAHPQALKIQSASPSQSMAARSATPTLSDSPQPSQASPLTLGQQIQSPHPPPSQPSSQPQTQPPSQPQAPSRSCTPSSIPPIFIIHNQISGSPQPPQTAAQILQQQPHPVQIPQVLPQPLVLQQEQSRASSCSPKPPQAAPAQFQFATPMVSAPAGTVLKQQGVGLSAEQQHHLQLLNAMSSISQPSAQQKQLLEKLSQQNILLQAKEVQPQAPSPFNKLPEPPAAQTVTSSASATAPASVPSLLQQKSVLVKTSAAGSTDTQVFSGTSGPSGVTINQGKPAPNLTQAVQAKPGVISAVGGLSLNKPGLQIQFLSSRISQMSSLQPPASVQTQSTTLKRPFIMEPSKEARMLEQLRKLQGSVLHPDYSSPFSSFEDTLYRLLPYHLYQGVTPSTQDYHKVDNEFENISSQLLKRTQAMLDKYRHLLFEESRRLGPSAEMVMIDRMFIQEEKTALNQDRILAKEKPEEFVANSCMLSRLDRAESAVAAEPSLVRTQTAPVPAPPAASTTPNPAPFPPTKLVIKQGGSGPSVSWSTSCPPAPVTAPQPCAETAARPCTRTPSSTYSADEDDALPQRTSKPPIKTYEARQRIGLKLKIKQEAGFSKVVHNTALDPVHLQPQNTPRTPNPEPKPRAAVTQPSTVIRTSPPVCTAASSSWAPTSCTASSQINGTLEHYESPKPNSTSTPSVTTTCRLPLRKTYRENISPRHRPGVPGGGDAVPVPSLASPESSPRAERTIIASVKLEQQGSSKPDPEPDPGSVDNEFYSAIKNHHRQHHKEDEDRAEHPARVMWRATKNQERAAGMFRMDQHAPGPPSPGETSWTRDSSLPAKRSKSDSPDMDNASFSSGSPPLDNSLNEHLQSAIDSILNLQQGLPTRGASNLPNRHQSAPGASSTSYRHSVTSSSSSSITQRPQLGGRGQNGGLVSQTDSR